MSHSVTARDVDHNNFPTPSGLAVSFQIQLSDSSENNHPPPPLSPHLPNTCQWENLIYYYCHSVKCDKRHEALFFQLIQSKDPLPLNENSWDCCLGFSVPFL